MRPTPALLLIGLLPALFSASGALAATPSFTITSLTPDTVLYPGSRVDFKVSLSVTPVQDYNYSSASVWVEATVNGQVRKSSVYTGTLSGGTATISFYYQVPPIMCGGALAENKCPANPPSMREAYQEITGLRVVASMTGGSPQVTAGAFRNLRFEEHRATLSHTDQALNTRKALRVTIPGAGFRASYVPSIQMVKAQNALGCGPNANQPGAGWTCKVGSGYRYSDPNDSTKVIDSSTFEVMWNTTTGAPAYESETDIESQFVGRYDVLVSWQAGGGSQFLTAFVPKGFAIEPAPRDDALAATKITGEVVVSTAPNKTEKFTWTPGQPFPVPARGINTIKVDRVDGTFRLDRYTQAEIRLALRDRATGMYLNGPTAYVRNTFEELHPIWDVGGGALNAENRRVACDDTYFAAGQCLMRGYIQFPEPLGAGLDLVIVMFPAHESREIKNPIVGPIRLAEVAADAPILLGVEHIETVQVVQTKANEIPMVAGKSTVVRVFPRVLGDNPKDASGARGVLKALRDGAPLSGSATLLNTNVVVASAGTPDREKFERSLNFLLPKEWLSGDVEFRATVWHGTSTTPPAETDKNTSGIAVSFRKLGNWPPVVRIGYIPFCFEMWGAYSNIVNLCPGDSIASADRLLAKILPVADGMLDYGPVPIDSVPIVQRANEQMVRLLRKIHLYGGLYSSDAYDLLTGWLPGILLKGDDMRPAWSENFGLNQAAGGGVSFQAETTGGLTVVSDHYDTDPPYTWSGWGYKNDADRFMFAHSMMHSLWLDHGSCQTGEVGFDTQEGKVIPANTRNLMAEVSKSCEVPYDRQPDKSFRAPVWISAVDYVKLLLTGAFKAGIYSAAGVKPPPNSLRGAGEGTSNVRAAERRSNLFVIGGTVERGGNARLDAVLRVESASSAVVNASGQYCIRMTGAAPQPPDTCFDLPFRDAPGEEPVKERSFLVGAPYAAGTTRIALLRDGQEIASLLGSPKTPDVSITSPAPGAQLEGRILLNWTASSPDGDAQSHSVLYSSDGGRQWLPLAVDTSMQQIAVDASQLKGGDKVQFQVVTSAGLNSGSAVLGPVSVIQRPRAEPAAGGIAFPNVKVGTSAERGWIIKNTGTGPLTVTVPAPVDPSLSLAVPSSFTVPAGSQRPVILRYAPLAEGKLDGALTVSTTDPDKPAATAPLTGQAYARDVPSLELPASPVVFGNVGVGLEKEISFAVANAGSSVLRVSQLSFSDRSFSAAPSTVDVAPGEEQPIQLRFSPTAAGERRCTLTIASDDPSRPKVEVAMTGTGIAASLSITPASLDFASVTAGQSKTLPLNFSNKGSSAISIKSISSDNGKFSASPGSFTLAAGASRDVNVEFKPAAAGSESGTLRIETDDPVAPAVRVVMTGRGTAAPSNAPRISADPAGLDFGGVTVGQTKDLTFEIANTGNAALTITSASSGTPVFSWVSPAPPFSVDPGARRTVTVRFAPAAAGAQTGTLTIASNDPVRPSVTVALTGAGQAAPPANARIDATPARLDFGAVTAGQAKDLNLAINSAAGTASLTVNSMTSDNARFTVVSPTAPFTVNAGSTATVTVRFSPDAASSFSATLTIRSNAANQPSLVVPLTGTGAAATGVQDRELQVDDGTFEQNVGYSSGAADVLFVNRLPALSYPVTLKRVRIYGSDIDEGIPLRGTLGVVAGLVSPDAELTATSVRLVKTSPLVLKLGQWLEIDVPEQAVPAGTEIVVGYSTSQAAGQKPAALDTSSRSQSRSFGSANSGRMEPISRFTGVDGNLAIRAVVTTGN